MDHFCLKRDKPRPAANQQPYLVHGTRCRQELVDSSDRNEGHGRYSYQPAYGDGPGRVLVPIVCRVLVVGQAECATTLQQNPVAFTIPQTTKLTRQYLYLLGRIKLEEGTA